MHHINRGGISIVKAANVYGIPKSTLVDRLVGRVKLIAHSGPEHLFPRNEEKKLAEHLQYMASLGYGYSRREVIHMATDIAIDRKIIEEDKQLSLCWFTIFMNRHPTLSLQKPIKSEIVRAKSSTLEKMNRY